MTTPNTPPTELDKAIEQTERYFQQCSPNVKARLGPQLMASLLLAAKRLKELEKVNKAYSEVIGTNAETIFSLQQRLEEVEKERDVEAKAYKDAIEILKEKHEELSTLRTGYKQALEALKPINFFLKDYLRTVTHPGVSRLVSDANEVLSTPLAIATMKGDQ